MGTFTRNNNCWYVAFSNSRADAIQVPYASTSPCISDMYFYIALRQFVSDMCPEIQRYPKKTYSLTGL